MTAEVRTFADHEDLVDFINAKYGAGSTTVICTVLQKSVYLLQYD